MKKMIYILFVLSCLSSIAALGFAKTMPEKVGKIAEASVEIIKGRVISIDTTKNEVVLKNNKTGAERTITADPKDIASLKTDEEIKVTLKAGSNAAESIKKIVKKAKSNKK